MTRFQRASEHQLLRRVATLLILAGLAPSVLAQTQPPKPVPIETQPYRIAFSLRCLPETRIDSAARAVLLRDWQNLVKRFIGSPWIVSVEPESSPLSLIDPANPAPNAFAQWTNVDKVWIARLILNDQHKLSFAGREYDVATRRLGSYLERPLHDWVDAPRQLLSFSLDLFSPTAMLARQEAGKAILTVRGAALEPASPTGQVTTKGAVFIPLRLVSLRNGTTQILRIPFTYLQVESVDGATAQCTITSALADPFTRRIARPSSIAAIAIKPGRTPLHLRFVTKPDKEPAAGYTLTAHLPGHTESLELGTTDRSGRIEVRPGFADNLMVLRLIAGRVEPLVEFPMMPGESSEERVIPIDPLPQTIALEARIDALRDQVVDLVALRARLEARMKARLEGEDWDGLDEALKEFQTLPPRDKIANALIKMKEEAAREQAETRKKILTRTAQAELADLQSTIDRYLDDDLARSYADALERGRALASKEKAGAKTKGTIYQRPTPAPTPAAVQTPRTETAASAPAAAPAPAAAARQPAPPSRKPAPRSDQTVPF